MLDILAKEFRVHELRHYLILPLRQMPLNESNVAERARRLLVCTNDAANFSDKMDVIFVAEMIEKISKFVEKFKDVSGCKSWKEGHCSSHPLLVLLLLPLQQVLQRCWGQTN